MKLYKVSIEIKSALGTSLKGDTLWGHVAWGIINNEGEESLIAFLQDSKSNKPPFIISSAFPHNLLPKPMIHYSHDELSTIQEYAKNKEEKSHRYIPSFLGNSLEGIKLQSSASPFTKELQLHNIVHRMSGSVEEESLFSQERYWLSEEVSPIFDIYIVSSYNKERILTLLNWAFEYGYGAGISTGNGKIEVLNNSIEEIMTESYENKRCIALGPFVTSVKPSTHKNLYSDIFIRRGKIGGAFATAMNPFKKTILMFDEGATFTSLDNAMYIGNLIEHVHTDPRICHSGFTPIIPLPTGEN